MKEIGYSLAGAQVCAFTLWGFGLIDCELFPVIAFTVVVVSLSALIFIVDFLLNVYQTHKENAKEE